MIPWWVVLIALALFGIWTAVSMFIGAAIAGAAREKADISLHAQEKMRWQVPNE